MNLFWNIYISVFTLGLLITLIRLIYCAISGKSEQGVKIGRSYDGIEEYNNPIPRWWLILFLISIIFSLLYLLLYPGLGEWKGILPGYRYLDTKEKKVFEDGETGWSSIHQWEKEAARTTGSINRILKRSSQKSLAELSKDPKVIEIGKNLFSLNCTVCHGPKGEGLPGYPNLTDSYWSWGGKAENIESTIMYGRNAIMPGWESIIDAEGINDITLYLLENLGGKIVPKEIEANASKGREIFLSNCAGCHGVDGSGNSLIGATKLTEPNLFIYGSLFSQVRETIRLGRNGQMPAQEELQGKDKVHVLSAYLYSLRYK